MKNNLRPIFREPRTNKSEEAPRAASEPSWFFDPANEGQREDLMARYRQARNPHESLQQPPPRNSSQGRQPRGWIEARPYPESGYLQPDDVRQMPRSKPGSKVSRVERSLPAIYGLAAAIAALAGGAAGFINAKIEPVTQNLQALVTSAGLPTPVAEHNTPPLQVQAVTETVISKKSIAIATLNVQDVTGETNSLIPLALHAEPALDGQDLLLKISGLPENAYLTSGHKSDQIWTLAIGDLKGLKLVMPEGSQQEIDVDVAAFERKTGELAAPVKSMTIALSNVVVQPVSAPPPGNATPTPTRPPAENQMAAIPKPISISVNERAAMESAKVKVSLGDGLVKKAHMTLARKAYQEAWDLGLADGAFGLARSYDPAVLKSLKVKRAHADSAIALTWYERAAAAGKIEAMSAISRLKQKP